MRRLKNLCLLGVILTLIIGTLAGCGSSSADDTEVVYVIYDLNSDKTALEQEPIEMEATSTDEMIQELVTELQGVSEVSDLMRPLPSGVMIQDYELDEESGKLTVSFTPTYSTLSGTNETLIRAAVVKTLLQVEAVRSVEFEVDHSALLQPNGNAYGPMNESTFVMTMVSTDEEFYEQEQVLKLYYPDESGEHLIMEEKEVTYDSNVPVGRVVMNYLKQIPETEGAKPAYSKETDLLSLSVADGVCYVNLESNFLTANTDVSETAAVYAIVNSLTELSGINKVLICVDGDILKPKTAEDTILYTRNEELVVVTEDETEESNTTEGNGTEVPTDALDGASTDVEITIEETTN